MMATVAAHRVTTVAVTTTRSGRTEVLGYRGSCSCGASTGGPLLTSAGMVSGWEAAHRTAEGDL